MKDNKKQALQEIKSIAIKNDINITEIINFLNEKNHKEKNYLAQKFLSYMSGIFVFAGICIYVALVWNDLNTLAKIIITLGTGVIAYIISIISFCNDKYKQITAPFLLISACLEPSGLFIILNEYFSITSNSIWLIVIISSVLFIQYIMTFIKFNITTSLFLSITFAITFFISISDVINIPYNLANFSLGISLMCISYSISKTNHKNLSPFYYLIASLFIFISAFDAVDKTIFELSFLCLSIIMVYISINLNSKTLLFTSACSLISFLGYYTAEYFVDSLGWPIMLIIIGLTFFAVSSATLKINKKYLK